MSAISRAAAALAKRKTGMRYDLSEAERARRRDSLARARAIVAERRKLARLLAESGAVQ